MRCSSAWHAEASTRSSSLAETSIPERISPRVRVCVGRDSHDVFSFCNLLQSVPSAPRAGQRIRHWEDRLAAFDEVVAEPEEVVEHGDQVVVVVKIRARPKGSSAEIEIRNGHVWTFRDGKPASMRLFPEPEKAFEAAGLSE